MTENKSKERRLAEIIDASVDEFVDKGFEKTTMESIAARAGLSKGGVYHHFCSKDEILLAASRKYLDPIHDIVRQMQEITSPTQKLKTYINDFVRYWAAHSKELTFTFLSITRSLSEPSLFEPLESYSAGLIELFSTIYDQGVEQGEFIPHDVRARALALSTGLDGVTTYLSSRHLNPDLVIESFTQVFVEDVLKV